MEECLVHPFKVKSIPRYSMSDKFVGLLLITYNDSLLLDSMLESLVNTINYPTVLLCVDIGSKDDSLEKLNAFKESAWFKNSNITDVTIVQRSYLESLAETMNYGFAELMKRQECEYIGWIHPDMLFTNNWLSNLVFLLETDFSIGKVCAYNIRDNEPNFSGWIEGHEQCYLIRRGVLLQIGLFDTRFKGIGGHEDHDMNNRIRQHGWHVVIYSQSKVFHAGMATRSRRDTSEEQRQNAERYFLKWGRYKEIPFEEFNSNS